MLDSFPCKCKYLDEPGVRMADRYDAVIVGAGINALACALHLASKGWRVGLFEGAESPGGAVKSGAYTLPGFTHDWAAMNLSLLAGSAFFRKHGKTLQQHGLSFAAAADCFASSFPDGSWLGVSTDPAATAARLAAVCPADAAAWGALVKAFPNQAATLFALLGSPMTMRALASFIFKTVRRRGMAGTLDLTRFLLASPRRWLDETFADARTKAMLAAWGMHLDFAPDIAGGAIFPYLEGMANQSFGMVIAQGGAQRVTDALVAAIRAKGGHVECGAAVERIVHRGRIARSVVLAGGREVTADRAVIAGVAPAALVRLTGGTRNDRFDAAMTRFDHAPGTMMIHLAMADLPDWRAGADLRRFAYVHIAPSLDQMARTYAQAKAGLLPDEPVIVVGQPTAIDPTRAPAGQHVLWLQVRMAPGRIRGDAAGRILATDWAGAAEPFADRAIDILEAHAPGTRARVLARRIVSPAELEADNPNLVGGDQISGSHHLAQNFAFRPVRGHADGTTPIERLYLTGAAVWPGAGTGAGSGFLLAQKLAGA